MVWWITLKLCFFSSSQKIELRKQWFLSIRSSRSSWNKKRKESQLDASTTATFPSSTLNHDRTRWEFRAILKSRHFSCFWRLHYCSNSRVKNVHHSLHGRFDESVDLLDVVSQPLLILWAEKLRVGLQFVAMESPTFRVLWNCHWVSALHPHCVAACVDRTDPILLIRKICVGVMVPASF